MDYLKELQTDLDKGYSKSMLEDLIGLPKNTLSGILNNGRKISKISQLKIEKWATSEKPNPLEVQKTVVKKVPKPATTIPVINQVTKRKGNTAEAIQITSASNKKYSDTDNSLEARIWREEQRLIK